MFFPKNYEGALKNAVTFKNFRGDVGIIYDPAYSRLKRRDYWKVIKSFTYYIGDGSSNEWFLIPKEFKTDGATVPRMLWSFVPPWGRYGPAVIVHDYLCDGGLISTKKGQRVASRKEADQIFLEAMKALKVGRIKRTCMYWGVRLAAIVSRTK